MLTGFLNASLWSRWGGLCLGKSSKTLAHGSMRPSKVEQHFGVPRNNVHPFPSPGPSLLSQRTVELVPEHANQLVLELLCKGQEGKSCRGHLRSCCLYSDPRTFGQGA